MAGATEKFDGQEKLICGSLFSWINDGSHFAIDDFYINCDPEKIERYLSVLQQIFEASSHDGQ
ncbi:AAA family ATPase [Hyphococcus sp. DH-69]|uniref:AAA family ATPase n=1 Tax=Hyphococcus formosus TaxID=3143534 RepID=UPI00398BAB23